MRVHVDCKCGWRRELSSFYQGKRIRCPECRTVLHVPGESERMYESPAVEQWLHRPSRRQGRWVHVHELRPRPRRRCSPMRVVPHLMMAGIVAFVLAGLMGLESCDRDLLKPADEAAPEIEPPPEVPAPEAAPPAEKPQESSAPKDDELDAEFEDEF